MPTPATLDGTVLLSRPAAGVALIELDNPPGNALGEKVRDTLCDTLDQVAADASLRVAILSARGRIFCGGDDLKEAVACTDRSGSITSFNALFSRIENLRFPVIAAVNGACAGGGLELALCCDIRLASENATFVASGVNVGLLASVVRLSRLIGGSRARAMLLSGRPVDAQEARESGLVASVQESGALLDGALELARRIATRAPLSIQAVKRVLARAEAAGVEAHERQELLALATSGDHREAIAAFAAGRAPDFVGA